MKKAITLTSENIALLKNALGNSIAYKSLLITHMSNENLMNIYKEEIEKIDNLVNALEGANIITIE